MSDYPYTRPTPLWVKAIIIICMLPIVSMPWLLGLTRPDTPVRFIVWFYPLYVIASGICAWICYGQRREMTWILLVLMLMSHAAIWLLVNQQ